MQRKSADSKNKSKLQIVDSIMPFIKNENKTLSKKIRFKLPTIDLLKIPTQKDRGKLKDEDFKEKINDLLPEISYPCYRIIFIYFYFFLKFSLHG